MRSHESDLSHSFAYLSFPPHLDRQSNGFYQMLMYFRSFKQRHRRSWHSQRLTVEKRDTHSITTQIGQCCKKIAELFSVLRTIERGNKQLPRVSGRLQRGHELSLEIPTPQSHLSISSSLRLPQTPHLVICFAPTPRKGTPLGR